MAWVRAAATPTPMVAPTAVIAPSLPLKPFSVLSPRAAPARAPPALLSFSTPSTRVLSKFRIDGITSSQTEPTVTPPAATLSSSCCLRFEAVQVGHDLLSAVLAPVADAVVALGLLAGALVALGLGHALAPGLGLEHRVADALGDVHEVGQHVLGLGPAVAHHLAVERHAGG